MRCAAAARLLDADDLVDDLRVAAGEERSAVDHHVDLVGTECDGLADILELHLDRRLSGREGGGHRGDLHGRAGQLLLRDGNEIRVDADRRHGRDGRVGRIRVHGLGAQGGDLARRVRALERRQIHHPDREVEGGELRTLLDRALRELARACLERDRVDGADPRQAQIEGSSTSSGRSCACAIGIKSSPARTGRGCALQPRPL